MVVKRIAGSLAAVSAACWCMAFAVPASAQAIVVAPTAPPPPQVETIPPPPASVDVWHPGHWAWTGANWNWIPGQYVTAPAPQATWIPGHWEQQPTGGYIWVDGHWAG